MEFRRVLFRSVEKEQDGTIKVNGVCLMRDAIIETMTEWNPSYQGEYRIVLTDSTGKVVGFLINYRIMKGEFQPWVVQQFFGGKWDKYPMLVIPFEAFDGYWK
jgi:hypothetical protein